LSQEDIGNRVGRDRSTVANTLRLLNLPLEAKRALVDGRISEGHARVVLSVVEPAKQRQILELMQKHGWTVRQSEEFARAFKGKTGTRAKGAARIAATNDLTRSISQFLGGFKVTQQTSAKGGKLVIEYTTDDELEQIYRSIRRD
jgi:ParB family chromosome partitioning protein